jgi:Na+-transporting methylmalonyl-CoA/oxaloacetate decarboxylase gamma subunit
MRIMALNMGELSGSMLSLFTTFWVWGLIIFLFLAGTIGFLLIRQKRKLIYPVVEVTDLGSGKVGLRLSKAGWFRSRAFWIYDYAGEFVMKLKDGREVQKVSSEDFHDINGTRGLLVCRKPDDPRVLLPINKAGTSSYYTTEPILDKNGNDTGKTRLVKRPLNTIKGMRVVNEYLLMEIAPQDYRDTASRIAFDAKNETMSKLEKIIPYIVFAGMGMIFIIAIILIVQMVKQGQANAKDLILEAGRMNRDQLAQICNGVVTKATEIASTAP